MFYNKDIYRFKSLIWSLSNPILYTYSRFHKTQLQLCSSGSYLKSKDPSHSPLYKSHLSFLRIPKETLQWSILTRGFLIVHCPMKPEQLSVNKSSPTPLPLKKSQSFLPFLIISMKPQDYAQETWDTFKEIPLNLSTYGIFQRNIHYIGSVRCLSLQSCTFRSLNTVSPYKEEKYRAIYFFIFL